MIDVVTVAHRECVRPEHGDTLTDVSWSETWMDVVTVAHRERVRPEHGDTLTDVSWSTT